MQVFVYMNISSSPSQTIVSSGYKTYNLYFIKYIMYVLTIIDRKGRDVWNKWARSPVPFLPLNFGDSEQHIEFSLRALSLQIDKIAGPRVHFHSFACNLHTAVQITLCLLVFSEKFFSFFPLKLCQDILKHKWHLGKEESKNKKSNDTNASVFIVLLVFTFSRDRSTLG